MTWLDFALYIWVMLDWLYLVLFRDSSIRIGGAYAVFQCYPTSVASEVFHCDVSGNLLHTMNRILKI